jgi:two-component system, chemotaxis family, chemotaxis protein CheY
MIMASLKPLNASFTEASSGLEAIEKLTLQEHDAVTLDLNMPDMHGLEFLKFLRKHSTFRDMPVLVVTTRDDEKMFQEVMEAGANAYLVKPFKPIDLLDHMKAILNQQKHGE